MKTNLKKKTNEKKKKAKHYGLPSSIIKRKKAPPQTCKSG
jgi:hypothetical protein